MKQFEYKILNINRVKLKTEKFQIKLIKKLNSLGKEGWEIISSEGLINSSFPMNYTDTTEVIIFFKREIKQS